MERVAFVHSSSLPATFGRGNLGARTLFSVCYTYCGYCHNGCIEWKPPSSPRSKVGLLCVYILLSFLSLLYLESATTTYDALSLSVFTFFDSNKKFGLQAFSSRLRREFELPRKMLQAYQILPPLVRISRSSAFHWAVFCLWVKLLCLLLVSRLVQDFAFPVISGGEGAVTVACCCGSCHFVCGGGGMSVSRLRSHFDEGNAFCLPQ